jgi:hypothetical protein
MNNKKYILIAVIIILIIAAVIYYCTRPSNNTSHLQETMLPEGYADVDLNCKYYQPLKRWGQWTFNECEVPSINRDYRYYLLPVNDRLDPNVRVAYVDPRYYEKAPKDFIIKNNVDFPDYMPQTETKKVHKPEPKVVSTIVIDADNNKDTNNYNNNTTANNNKWIHIAACILLIIIIVGVAKN